MTRARRFKARTRSMLHVCALGAERALCGGVLLSALATVDGRRTRADVVELADPRTTPGDGCRLEDVELEMGWLSMRLPSSPSRPCSSCLAHVARMRHAASPPIRHTLAVPGAAACGRPLRAGLASTDNPGAVVHEITDWTPGVLLAPIDCPTCVYRIAQRAERMRVRAVREAQLHERRELKQLNRSRQRDQLDASDRAFAWLDETDSDSEIWN